jgi:agmatinase
MTWFSLKNLDFVCHNPEMFCGMVKETWEDQNSNYNMIGIPLDISSSYRQGSRHAPIFLRNIMRSENFECFSETGKDLTKYFRIKDWGNIGIIPTDIKMSLKHVSEGIEDFIGFEKPFLVLGGDHSSTIGIGDAFEKTNTPVHYIYIDAHMDLYDEVKESRLSHACTLRRLSERESFSGATLLGYRDFSPTQVSYANHNDIQSFTTASLQSQNDLFEFGTGLIRNLVDKHQYFHISVDLDVLDPSFAPGVGNPVACGISSRELISLLSGIFNGLSSKKYFSWDIVEYNPMFDYAEVTAFTVIKMLIESLSYQIPLI